jgi:hypothetical protein
MDRRGNDESVKPGASVELGIDPSVFMDAIRDFVMSAVAFRDAEIYGNVGGKQEAIASVEALADQPRMFADLLRAAESVVETAKRYELISESDEPRP